MLEKHPSTNAVEVVKQCSTVSQGVLVLWCCEPIQERVS